MGRPVDLVVEARQVQVSSKHKRAVAKVLLEFVEGPVDVRAHGREDRGVDAHRHETVKRRQLNVCRHDLAPVLSGQRNLSEPFRH